MEGSDKASQAVALNTQVLKFVLFICRQDKYSLLATHMGGNKLKKFKAAGLSSLVLAIAVIGSAGPSRAETKALAVGKYTPSAAFPCAPQRQKQLVAKTEMGDIFFTSLMCSQGDNAYLLGVTEYPAQIMTVLSVEEMLDSTLDDARSKKFMKIKSSKRTTLQNLPAIRNHLLDSRKPQTESISTVVLADGNLIVVQVTAPQSSAQSKAATDFLNSLQVAAAKSKK